MSIASPVELWVTKLCDALLDVSEIAEIFEVIVFVAVALENVGLEILLFTV